MSTADTGKNDPKLFKKVRKLIRSNAKRLQEKIDQPDIPNRGKLEHLNIEDIAWVISNHCQSEEHKMEPECIVEVLRSSEDGKTLIKLAAKEQARIESFLEEAA